MDDEYLQELASYYDTDPEHLSDANVFSNRDEDNNIVELDNSESDKTEFEIVESIFGPDAEACCSSKCNSILPRDLVCTSRNYFNELSKLEQDFLIIGHLQSHRQHLSLQDHYNKRKNYSKITAKKRFDSIYLFRGVRICKRMYLFINNVGVKRYENIVRHFDERGLTTRSHGLCRKISNQSRITPEVRVEIVRFIQNFAEQCAIPLPGRLPQFKNFKVMKLPSCESKISVYRRYIDTCSDDKTKMIGERAFYYLWDECCPYIQTMKPASDLCDTCKENTDRISQAKNEAEREELLNIALNHLVCAKGQRQYYNECCAAPTDPDDSSTRLVISFDFAQNVSYPSGPQRTGQSYFKSARKCFVFGILNETTKIQTNYLIDENDQIGKGPNSTVSMVHHYLEANPADTIIAFADNCVAQNKNNTMIHYLSWRMRNDFNKKISLNFLLTGHTKFGPDRMFGIMKSKFAKTNIDCYDDFVQCVNTSSYKGHNISVRGESVAWKRWDAYFANFNRSLTGITTYHHFDFESDKVMCRKYYIGSETVDFHLRLEDPVGFPETITPEGLSLDRQWYLFENIRSLCTNPTKCDNVAPKPQQEKTKKQRKDDKITDEGTNNGTGDTKSTTNRKRKKV